MFKTLLGTSAATAVTAAIGAVASSDTKSLWYRTLRKPVIQPPAIAFPVVWTALYATIAGSSAVVLHRAKEDNDDGAERAARFRTKLALNLVLNASWSWVFFKAHKLAPAVAVAGALAISSADLAAEAAKTSRGAGAALVPYAAWCTFATVLSAAILRKNPRR